jgi:hypothetical protein
MRFMEGPPVWSAANSATFDLVMNGHYSGFVNRFHRAFPSGGPAFRPRYPLIRYPTKAAGSNAAAPGFDDAPPNTTTFHPEETTKKGPISRRGLSLI